MTVVLRATIGAIIATGIGYGAVRAQALTWSGGVAAAIIGTVAVAAGWNWAAVLIAYFVATLLLSRLGKARKQNRMAGVVDKTGARDATQVMANGFPFMFCVLTAMITSRESPWMICAAGSLAASAADTWATEIGTLVGQLPRSILTWRPVAVGESGGVTRAGWAATFAGAAFVGVAAIIAGPGGAAFPYILAGGIAGGVVDSVVGASLQRRGWCDACRRRTEMRVHDCGATTTHLGGLAWLENDGVNLIATTTGALVPWLLLTLVPGGRG